MARRRGRKSYRHYTQKIPMALTAGLAGTILGSSHDEPTILFIERGDYRSALIRVVQNLTGYHLGDHTWGFENSNLMPLAVGAMISIVASKLGINRRLSAIGLPVKL